MKLKNLKNLLKNLLMQLKLQKKTLVEQLHTIKEL